VPEPKCGAMKTYDHHREGTGGERTRKKSLDGKGADRNRPLRGFNRPKKSTRKHKVGMLPGLTPTCVEKEHRRFFMTLTNVKNWQKKAPMGDTK